MLLSSPGACSANRGIQWLLRGARLDPGSALRAVRDDVPARRYAPSGMTSKLGAVREDRPARRRAPTTTTLQGARVRHILFAVIPGRVQREPGIQWRLRGARLYPGSALRAVRDDAPARRSAPSGMTSAEGARRSGWHQMLGVRPYRIEGEMAGRERRNRIRPCRMSHLPSPGDFLTNPVDRLVPARRARPHQRFIPRLVHRRCG